MHRSSRVKPATKGALLGAANALTIGVLAAISEGELRYAPFDATGPTKVLACAVTWGCTLGAVAGLFVGVLVDDLGELRRTMSVVFANLVSILVSLVIWPELLGEAMIPTTIYALIFARWTTPPDHVPTMAIVERRS